MGKLSKEMKEYKENTMRLNATLDWDAAIHAYFEHMGYIQDIKYEMMKHLNEEDYIIEIKLGGKNSVCSSLGRYLFDTFETTLSDEGLIKQLMIFAKENHGTIRTIKYDKTETLDLLLPIKNLKY